MEGRQTLACGRLVAAMTRCECSELSFEDIVRRVREGGRSLDGVQAETGAGLLCTACLPDLRAHLAAEGVAASGPGSAGLGAGALDSLADPD
jgi:NAD(P)H-nitrite reductase large subunit